MGMKGMFYSPQWPDQKAAVQDAFGRIEHWVARWAPRLALASIPALGLAFMAMMSPVSNWWLGVAVVIAGLYFSLRPLADRASFVVLLLGSSGVEGHYQDLDEEFAAISQAERKKAHRSLNRLDRLLLILILGRHHAQALLSLPHRA